MAAKSCMRISPFFMLGGILGLLSALISVRLVANVMRQHIRGVQVEMVAQKQLDMLQALKADLPPDDEGEVWSLSSVETMSTPSSAGGHAHQEDAESVTPPDNDIGRNLHVVFSSGCNRYQQWQAEVLLHSHHTVGQPGNITRIVSGCGEKHEYTGQISSESTKRYKSYYQGIADEIQPLEELSRTSHPHMRLHVTQDFAGADKFPWLNKPLGLADWVQNAKPPLRDEEVVIIVDVDMILLDRIIPSERFRCTSGCPGGKWGEGKFEDARGDGNVKPGVPVAQLYGIGGVWVTKFASHIPKWLGEDSPAAKMSVQEASRYLSVGPPLIMSVQDLRKVAPLWAKLTKKVVAVDPEITADMYAYCMACAHLGLRHLAYDDMMVSAPEYPEGEAWVSAEASWRGHELTTERPFPRRSGKSAWKGVELPSVLHLCQTYNVKGWTFHKGMVPGNFLQCHVPLLLTPPIWSLSPGKDEKLFGEGREGLKLMRNARMLSAATIAINEAATQYKGKYCIDQGGGNVTKAIRLTRTHHVCQKLGLKDGFNCWGMAIIEGQ